MKQTDWLMLLSAKSPCQFDAPLPILRDWKGILGAVAPILVSSCINSLKRFRFVYDYEMAKNAKV